MRIPTYERGQVSLADMPNVTVRESVNIEAGANALARGVQSIGNALGEIAQRETQKADDAALMQADNELFKVETDLLHDPEHGAYAVKGKDAIGIGERVLPEWDKRVSDILSRAPKRVQDRVMELANRRKQGAQRGLMTHSTREGDAYYTGQATSGIQLAVEEAGLNYLNDERVMEAAAKAKILSGKLSDLSGDDENTRALRDAKTVSAVYESVINRRLQDDPVKAEQYFLANEKYLTAESQGRLREQFAPYMDDRAGTAAADMVESGVIPGAGTEDYPSMRRRLESGGQADNVVNPRSGAMGRDQFVGATWLSIVKQENPPWAKGLSQDEILALRADPEKSGEMAAALDRANAKGLIARGVPVTNTTLYMAWHFGEAVGARIAKAPDGTPMASLVGKAALEDNPYLRGKTKGQVVEHWRSRGLSDGQPQAGRPPANLSEAIALTQQIPDPKVRRLAQATIRQRYAVKAEAERQAIEDFSMSVYDRVEKDGGKTPLDKLLSPEERRQAVKHGLWDNFEGMHQDKVLGRIPKTDRVLYETLVREMVMSPQTFAKHNLAAISGKFATKDYVRLTEMQQDIRNPDGGKSADWISEAGQLEEAYKSLGINGKTQANARGAFESAYRREVEAFAQKPGGRKPGVEDRQIIINRLLLPMSQPGMFWWSDDKTVPLVNAGPEARVPEAEAKVIQAKMLSQGIMPTSEGILLWYLSNNPTESLPAAKKE